MTQHDEKAVPMVVALFRRYHFEGHVLGTEADDESFRMALRGQSDRTSIMLRFRPDRTFVKQGARSVLCEIKSEGGKYANFAVEADSYRAAMEWNAAHRHVCFAFVDLGSGSVFCCWADQVPRPRAIRVPRRWDFGANMRRLQAEMPGAILHEEPYRPGPFSSGTPYFLVPKGSPFLVLADQFIARELGPA